MIENSNDRENKVDAATLLSTCLIFNKFFQEYS